MHRRAAAAADCEDVQDGSTAKVLCLAQPCCNSASACRMDLVGCRHVTCYGQQSGSSKVLHPHCTVQHAPFPPTFCAPALLPPPTPPACSMQITLACLTWVGLLTGVQLEQQDAEGKDLRTGKGGMAHASRCASRYQAHLSQKRESLHAERCVLQPSPYRCPGEKCP